MKYLHNYQGNQKSKKMKLKSIKSTFRIATIELNSMFYSPVAWLILIIFAIQIGYGFAMPMAEQIKTISRGHELWSVSDRVFTNIMTGFLPRLLKTLYLYIPLLTMGLMSREYYSGSIKLLYSSPIKNSSIILGKFLAMIFYGLALMAIITIFVLFSVFVIEDFELGRVLTAMLGIFLLFLSYAAIGLFMSSITKYQVVAALGTLAVLASLNYVGEIGQDTDFIRDITYWLSITGRSGDFLSGLVSSEHIAYYLVIIVFFISLSILKLNTEKVIMSRKVKFLKYSSIVLVTFVVGVFTSSPFFKVYYDATHIKGNTLSAESKEILSQLNGALTITTYVNAIDQDVYTGLPRNRSRDARFFEKYVRFKPEIKFKYIYYWDKTSNRYMNERYKGLSDEEKARRFCISEKIDYSMFLTPQQINERTKPFDLATEGNKFIRVLEYEDDKRAILRVYNDTERQPGEAEISSALKRFVSPAPMVGFTTGYGSRDISNYGDRGYYLFAYDKYFRQSLLNQGFDTKNVDLDRDNLAGVDILVISDLRDSLSPVALAKVEEYIAKGGNIFILGDYLRDENMNKITSSIGVKFGKGFLAQKNKYSSPSVLFSYYTPESVVMSPSYRKLQRYNWRVAMPTCVALDYSAVTEFNVTEILVSPKEAWTEYETTDLVDGEFEFNPAANETQGVFPTLIALSREVNGKQQRIMVAGDADFIANQELGMERSDASKSNYNVITGSFRWLSNDKYPVDISRADQKDNIIYMPKGSGKWVNAVSYVIIPLILIISAIVIIVRRQRK